VASESAAAVKSWKCSGCRVFCAKRVVSVRVRPAAAARGAERRKVRRERSLNMSKWSIFGGILPERIAGWDCLCGE